AEYRILLDDKDWEVVEELTLPLKSYQTMHVVPVLAGAGSDSTGIFMTILGVLLIAVAVIFAVATVGAGAPLSAYVGALGAGWIGLAFTAGVALTLGGVSQLLAP